MPAESEYNNVVEMFEKAVGKFCYEQRPMLLSKVNVTYQGISFAGVREKVDDVAVGLASIGVRKGDHVALISENRPEWVFADLGMLSLGAVNVPLYTTLSPKQIEYIFNDAGVRFAIVSNQLQLNKVLRIIDTVPTLDTIVIFSEKGQINDSRVKSFSTLVAESKASRKEKRSFVETEQQKIRPDDILTIIYTSGTTGNPKGVMLTHRNLVSNIRAALDVIPFTKEDILLSYLPLCHSFERMAGYYTAVSVGATIAFAESIDTLRENMIEINPTIMTTVPVLFERMYNRIMKQINAANPIRQKIFSWALGVGRRYAHERRNRTASVLLTLQYDIADQLVYKKIKQRTGGRLRFFVSGGAALAKELGEFFESVGLTIIEGYGMTETSPVISVNRVDEYKFGSVGPPIPGVEVKIAPDGEILVRGPNVMKGYWNNPKETAEVIDSESWLHTGDIGRFDENGFLVITDRKKHIFVSSGGKNIAPQPIENLFQQSQYISQFILIGDKKMFCSALIVPDFEALSAFAAERSLRFTSHEDLIKQQEVAKLFEKEIDRLQKDLSQYERVRKFTLITQPFTIENGELTPTLKVKRNVVEERYKNYIERMYKGVS